MAWSCKLTYCIASILVPNWSTGKPAAFNLSVTSPLKSNVLLQAGLAAGQAARATEQRKQMMPAKCKELGWVCVPMVVEAYDAWGTEAMESLALLASRLVTSTNRANLAALYGRLYLNLVIANATAILSRCFAPVVGCIYLSYCCVLRNNYNRCM